MNHRSGRVRLLAALALVLAAAPASAQLESNLTTLSGEQAEGYLGPLSSGISGMLNSGIFRSGDVPFVGFNFSLDLKAVIVSFDDADRVFTTPDVPGFGTTEAPTVIGDTQSVSQSGPGGATLQYPGGFDLEKFGIAVPQLTIGSVLGTRAIVRYISLSLADENEDLGDFTLWGIGGQHSISRYLPGFPVDVAAGVMYQQFNIGDDDLVKANALALNVTGSRKFGAVISVEPYVGVGLDSFSMDAEYTAEDDTNVSVSFDRENDFHGTLGANVNLPILKVHGEVNLAATNGYALGVSFGI